MSVVEFMTNHWDWYLLGVVITTLSSMLVIEEWKDKTAWLAALTFGAVFPISLIACIINVSKEH